MATELAHPPTDEDDQVIDTNVKGVYLGCREAFKVMKKAGGGTILFLAYEWERRLLPSWLVVVHALVAVIAFVLLVVAAFGQGSP